MNLAIDRYEPMHRLGRKSMHAGLGMAVNLIDSMSALTWHQAVDPSAYGATTDRNQQIDPATQIQEAFQLGRGRYGTLNQGQIDRPGQVAR